MLYAFQLRAHHNARYQGSLLSLAQKEMACMLSACGLDSPVRPQTLGGAPFLCFEAPALSEGQRRFLCGHSSLYMTCALEGDLLRPLALRGAPTLPQDMPEILNYKGKTNARFTDMMINLALSAGGQWAAQNALVLDPICGHGTTMFCALSRGMDAVGVDSDAKALREGLDFARKWLQFHRLQHTLTRGSETLPEGRSAPSSRLRVRGPEGERSITFLQADTRQTGRLLRRAPACALVADLPYGVQHAPRDNGRVSSLEALLAECLPAWREALRPGCAAAIAFNTHTLKRAVLTDLATKAGFQPAESPLYQDFSHWVEQAVARDVLVALRPRA
ncbi:MAG: hypothetical protein IJU28_04070 [Clostridia bacterium]|nr:hypothetical protein [Clostridia bacterium]